MDNNSNKNNSKFKYSKYDFNRLKRHLTEDIIKAADLYNRFYKDKNYLILAEGKEFEITFSSSNFMHLCGFEGKGWVNNPEVFYKLATGTHEKGFVLRDNNYSFEDIDSAIQKVKALNDLLANFNKVSTAVFEPEAVLCPDFSWAILKHYPNPEEELTHDVLAFSTNSDGKNYPRSTRTKDVKTFDFYKDIYKVDFIFVKGITDPEYKTIIKCGRNNYFDKSFINISSYINCYNMTGGLTRKIDVDKIEEDYSEIAEAFYDAVAKKISEYDRNNPKNLPEKIRKKVAKEHKTESKTWKDLPEKRQKDVVKRRIEAGIWTKKQVEKLGLRISELGLDDEEKENKERIVIEEETKDSIMKEVTFEKKSWVFNNKDYDNLGNAAKDRTKKDIEKLTAEADKFSKGPGQ